MWDDRYSEPGYAYGSEPNDFLVSVVERIPPGPVLCLAEGEGRNAVFLASRGHAVTAVDASAIGLGKARSLAAERKVTIETVCSDLADYTITPDHWAGIVCIWCHLPGALRERVHRAAAAGLRSGGVIVLEAYTPAQLALGTGGPKVSELLYTRELLERDFEGLEWIIARETEREIHEGKYHGGRSAVVQLVGRKP
jgi:SAM-dependent methyltransferase